MYISSNWGNQSAPEPKINTKKELVFSKVANLILEELDTNVGISRTELANKLGLYDTSFYKNFRLRQIFEKLVEMGVIKRVSKTTFVKVKAHEFFNAETEPELTKTNNISEPYNTKSEVITRLVEIEIQLKKLREEKGTLYDKLTIK